MRRAGDPIRLVSLVCDDGREDCVFLESVVFGEPDGHRPVDSFRVNVAFVDYELEEFAHCHCGHSISGLHRRWLFVNACSSNCFSFFFSSWRALVSLWQAAQVLLTPLPLLRSFE